MKIFKYLFLILLVGSCLNKPAPKNNESKIIRENALKEWKAMKFGLFIHWGVYSIPAGVWKGKQIEKLGEQIQRHAHIPNHEYVEIAKQFNPLNFDADKIVLLAKNAGMKYIVLTAKHHDGFCMFDSKYTDFDIINTAKYKKDILRLLADACAKHNLKLGIYYSTPDWNFNGPNPEVNMDDNKISVFSKVSKANEDYQVNQLRELLTNYGDIVELFFDMGEPTAEQSKRFAEAVHAVQPKCVINGRIMNNQGDFITMPDNHVPDVPVNELAWESPGTFYHTWGYKSWVKGDTLPVQIKNQIHKLALISARGGNFLLNIGPKADGSVLKYEQDVLLGVGEWMNIHSEAIYETGTTPFKRLNWGECTTKDNTLYLHVFNWPKDGKLVIPGLSNRVTKAYALSDKSKILNAEVIENEVVLDVSKVTQNKNLTVIAVKYDGKLLINHTVVAPSSDGHLLLSDDKATRHGKYGRESYRSILKDYYRTWEFEILDAGKYAIMLDYNMKFKSKKFIVEVADNRIPFELFGSATAKAKALLIDGNESFKNEISATKKSKKNINKLIGEVEFYKPGKYTLKLLQGEEFQFKTTIVDFKKQDHRYRSVNLKKCDIQLVRL